MTESKETRRKMTTAEYGAYLMSRIHKEIDSGKPPNIAVETAITSKQYDWLCDHDFDLDTFTLGSEKAKNAKEFSNSNRTRRLSPEGYKKKYPETKQGLYNGIVAHLKENANAEIIEPAKMNFRDIDFTVNGTLYKIVLSMPRKKV